MEGAELQPAHRCLHSLPKLPLRIIEYVWAHKMMDILEVVDPSTWPEVDTKSLNLEDSWRLRVTSAQIYSLVKNRDVENFERVISFLEATYRLLPRLVAPIKHMKIMFGLKTMVVMWMLREGRGLVDTVFKINQFFPTKLPQYQGQCSQHEMYLMRKNHLDFKDLAQTLAMNKDKLEDYIKNQMEEQYGEHYAQKVEDRLLHYLHELESVLPGDTYIDKTLKKKSPRTEEEKRLLEVITSDSKTIAATLKKLLNCDVASCRLGGLSQPSEHGKNGMESCKPSKSGLHGSSSKALLKSDEDKTQAEVFRGREQSDQDVSMDSPLLLKNDNDSDVKRHQRTEEDVDALKWVEEESCCKEGGGISEKISELVWEPSSSPQFCSKHQRWVNSILQECPDECSEELLLQANLSTSPLLFQSSSSITSSQDITPSGFIPCSSEQQHPPPQTSSHLQTEAQACEQANPEDKLSSGSTGSANDTFEREPLPRPSSSGDTLLPALLSPVVQLIDIATVRGIFMTFEPHKASPNHFTMSYNEQAASASSPQVLTPQNCHTSGNDAIHPGIVENSTFDQPQTITPTSPPNTTHQLQTSPVSQDQSIATSCQPPTRPLLSRLSRKFRPACSTPTHSQALERFSQNHLAQQFHMAHSMFQTSCPPLPDDSIVSGPPTPDALISTSQSGTLSSVCTTDRIRLSTELSQHVVPQSSNEPPPQTQNRSLFQSKDLPCAPVVSSNFNCVAVRSETSRVPRAQLKLSLTSQALLLQSKMLQPHVSLIRLSAQECYQLTNGRPSTRYVEPVVQESNDDNDEDMGREEEEDAASSFDVNVLYSSHSSNSASGDSFDCDPDYKPCIKKQRLLLEYERARSLINI